MDPSFRDRGPRMVIDENGKERLTVEGKLLGNPRGIGSLGAVPAQLLDLVRAGRGEHCRAGDYIGPHKIIWATDYPHQDGFFPGAPQMIGERIGPLSPAARHQVLAGGAMGFYGLQ